MLPYVRLALNTAVHRSIGEQPLYLLTGQHGYFPLGLTNTQVNAPDTAEALRGRLRVARIIAMETSRRARDSWARYYNRKVKKEFRPDVGTLVLVKDTPREART